MQSNSAPTITSVNGNDCGLVAVMRQHCKALFLTAFTLVSPLAFGNEKPLVFGQLAPFTNLPVPEAAEINQGVNAYLTQINKTGLKGRQLSLFKLDDEYNADRFVVQFNKAMEQKPLALITPIGANALKRMLDDKLLDKFDVVVLNAIPGAESLRTPGHPRFFHLRAGDKQQIEKIVSNAKAIGIVRLSVLSSDQEVGLSGARVAQEEAIRVGGLQFKNTQSQGSAEAIATASAAVADQKPQGVLVVGAPRFAAEGVAALRKAGIGQPIFVLSYVQPGLLVKLAGLEGARGVGIAQTYPNPNKVAVPVLREFQAAMKASFPAINQYTANQLEGYLCARTLSEAIKRIKQKEITSDALARSLKTMGPIDFGGYRVDFTNSNVGSQYVDIAVIGSDGNLKY